MRTITLALAFLSVSCSKVASFEPNWALGGDEDDSDSSDKETNDSQTDGEDSDNNSLADEPSMIGGSYLTCSLLRTTNVTIPTGQSPVGCRVENLDRSKTEIPPTVSVSFTAYDSAKASIDGISFENVSSSDLEWHYILAIPSNRVPRSSIEARFQDEVSGKEATLTGAVANSEGDCWVAVSGGYFGITFTPTFPATNSGNPITHGERFDTVGGIYLGASPQPYLAPTSADFNISCNSQSGARDIEDAVCRNSVDSIAVAPGMILEVRDGAGTLLVQENGPYMAISNEFNDPTDATNVRNFLLGRSPKMPEWMNAYLESIDFNVPSRPLWPTRSVQAMPIAGSKCE